MSTVNNLHSQAFFQGQHVKMAHFSIASGSSTSAVIQKPFDTIMAVHVSAGTASPGMNTVYTSESGKQITVAGLTNNKTYRATLIGY